VEQISHDEQKQYHLNRQGTTTAPETGRIRTGSAAEELLREPGQSQRGQNGERTIVMKAAGGKAKIAHTRDIVEDEPIHRRGWTKHQQ